MRSNYLAISLFNAPLAQVVEVALSVLPSYRADPIAFPPLPVQGNWPTEPQGTLWQPLTNPDRCVLMGHQRDGWLTLTNLLALRMKVPVFRLRATSEESSRYVCSFEYWSGGLNTRSVLALNDEPWVFRQSGEPLAQEDVGRYKSKRIRDRVTPQCIASLATRLGWPVMEAAFWNSEGLAYVLRSEPPAAQNAT